MPLYEYQCDACGERFELIRKFSDPPVDACTRCGKGPVTRLLSSPAIQFKGSGWYITDYSRKGKPEGAAAKDKGGEQTGGKQTGGEQKGSGDAAPAETSKTEAKTDAGGKSASPVPAAPARTAGGAKD